jgi:hypothetical protein
VQTIGLITVGLAVVHLIVASEKVNSAEPFG